MRRITHRRRRAVAVLGTLALLAAGLCPLAAAEETGRIERIALEGDGSATKVVITLSRPIAFDVHVLDGDAAQKSARRLVLDFANTTLAPDAAKPIAVANDLLRQIRPGQFNARTARIVLDLASDTTHSVDAFDSPPHVTIALAGAATAGTPPTAAATTVGTPPASAAATTVETPPAAAPDTAKTAARTIPIRARGRRPYSLIYSR